MKNSNVMPYILLMRKALSGDLSLEKFASDFIILFQKELGQFDDNLFEILNSVSLDADEYVPSNSTLLIELQKQNSSFVIEDKEFIERIRIALEKLERISM